MRVGELFDVRYGHSLELNRLRRVDAPAGVNFVSRAMRNNGVTARVEAPAALSPGRAGELTVALSGNGVLSTFVQPEPFLCAFHVAVLAPKRADMGLSQKLWWARCIHENRYRFSYGRQANRSLSDLQLPDDLPAFVTSTILPDLAAAKSSLGPPIRLPDTSSWGTWTFQDLFTVLKGRRVTKRQRTPGPTPFVGATMRNNGVTDHFAAKAWGLSRTLPRAAPAAATLTRQRPPPLTRSPRPRTASAAPSGRHWSPGRYRRR